MTNSELVYAAKLTLLKRDPWFLLVSIVMLFAVGANGAVRYSVNTGNWNSTSTWSATSGGSSGASVPVAGDIVYIENNNTVTINANAYCATMSIAPGAMLTVGGYTINFSSSVNIEGTLRFTSTTGTKTLANVSINEGTWTSNAGETYAISSLTLNGSVFNGSSTGVFNISNDLTIAEGTINTLNAATITVSGNTNISGTFIISSSSGSKTFLGMVTITETGEWLNTANESIVFRGGLECNGSFNSGTGNHTFNSNNQTISGTISINKVVVTGVSLTNTGELTVSTSLTGTGNMINGVNGTLSIKFGAAIAVTTFTASSQGNLVIYDHTGDQTVRDADYYNLTLAGNRGSNDITIGTIGIAGTLLRTAVFTGGSGITAGTIEYNGSAPQTILETDSYFSYNNIIVNNPTGVSLNNHTEVLGTLTFNSGIINTGAFTLMLGSSASISGAGTGKYVNGSLSKGIAASTASKSFEIGDAITYAPVTLVFSGSTNSSGQIIASTVVGDHPQVGSSIIDPIHNVNRYWILSNSGVTGFTSYNVTFQFVAEDLDPGADYSEFLVGNYVTSSWSYPNIGTRTNTTTQATGLTTFGDFQIGACTPPGQPGTITGNAETCAGTVNLAYSVPQVDDYTYSWTVPSGWSITSGQGTSSITVTAGSTGGNIEVTAANSCSVSSAQTKAVSVLDFPSNPGDISGSNSVCQGSAGLIYSVVPTNGISYTWELPTGWIQTGGGSSNTITVTANSGNGYIRVTPSNACGEGPGSTIPVIAQESPETFASSSLNEICSGNSVDLTASATPASPSATLLDEGFNESSNNWITINNTTGGNNELAAWFLRPDGFSSTYSGPMHSNDASQFYFSDSDLPGNGSSTSTILQSPPISTIGYSSLTLTFYHYFRVFLWGETGTIQVSTDGTNWSNYYVFTSNRGTPSSFYGESFNMSAYTGNQTLYIRFKYDADWGYYWALDNVVLSGIPSGYNYEYSWTADPLGTAGLPAGAGTPSAGNSDITVSPTTTTTYTVYAVSQNNCSSSEDLIISVSPSGPVSVSIEASENSICEGETVTFTASPANGGSSPAYQWKKNGSNVGTNNPVYSTSSLNDNDLITCVMTSSESCVTGNPATSNTITMDVNQDLPVSVSIVASANPICEGSSVTFAATPVNGGATPVYQWYVNGSPVGTNSSSFTTSDLDNNDQVTCLLTSSETCTSNNPATSNTITQVVNPQVTAGISISESSNPICAGDLVTFTAIVENGGASPAFQWKVNGSNVGTNASTYSTTTLSDDDIVTCVLTSNASCVNGSPSTSNSITMTVNPVLAAAVSIEESQNPICSGTLVTFTATPVNGGTSPSYQWKKNGVNVGTNSSTYASSALVNGDAIQCIMTSNAGCASGSPAASNTIIMEVNPNLAVSVSIASGQGSTICSGVEVEFTATPVNGGSSPSYQWKKNGSNTGTNSSVYSDATLNNCDIILCILTSNQQCTSGNPATSNNIIMTVNATPASPVSVAANPTSIYSDETDLIQLTASGGGGPNAVLRWYSVGCGIGDIIGTGNPISVSPPEETTTYYARWENGSCLSGCEDAEVAVYHLYRSRSTGDWNQSSTWEYYRGNSWIPAVSWPTASDGTITLKSPYTVSVPSSGNYFDVDEVTIDAGAKLIIQVCPSNWWFNIIDGPGVDLVVNGTMEYQDDKVSFASGATMAVGDGGRFQHNLNYAGNYPITAPTASWHTNSTYEVLSSNQLAPLAGFDQTFGNFTWNYSGQTATINLGGVLSAVSGNFTVTSTGSGQLELTNTNALTLDVGEDFILQNGSLNISAGAASPKVLNLHGDFLQSGGTFMSTDAIPANIHFKGNDKTFTRIGGTLISSNIDWYIDAGASLLLNSDLQVETGKTFSLGGTLDCGLQAITGTGSFSMSDGAMLIMASPGGITDQAGVGNIQTTSTSFASGGDFKYNGISAQTTGNRLPPEVRNLILQNSQGVSLSNSLAISGQLNLTSGIFSVGSNSLTLLSADIPLIRTTGSLSVTENTNLGFGRAGSTGGASFTLPDNLFSILPALNNLSIYRSAGIGLNNQVMSVKGTVLCNGPLQTHDRLKLLSSAQQTALIDGSGSAEITGNVTMQRYLASSYGYKYFSSPFQATAVGDFDPYVELSATFPCFYEYDENREVSGWMTYTDPELLLTPMKGYAVNLGESPSALTIELSGEVTNGLQPSWVVMNHNYEFTQGFHLAGNPYPSPIDWDANEGWTRANMDDAVYYFNAGSEDIYSGTYSSYINGVSSDGLAGNIIPAMQGFFVHVSDGTFPVTGAFSMDNRVRVNDLTSLFHKSQAELTRDCYRLSVSFNDKGHQADHVVLYRDETTSLNFDKNLDALKLWNTDRQVPNLYLIAPDGKNLSIKALPHFEDSTLVIQLGLKTEREGNLFFTTSSDYQQLFGMRTYLADAKTGVVRELQPLVSYETSVGIGEETKRFSLIFSRKEIGHEPPMKDVFNVSAMNGMMTVFMDLSAGTEATLSVSNMLGQVLVSKELTGNGYHELDYRFPSGIYLVNLHTSRAITTRKIFIQN